ncbi:MULTISPECIES: hypothetical protein [Snodgrassella]|uniref:Uncharacterized protein n=1 Tax=Snodgrassella alvi TaxID=1196083 RepID=A0ABD7Z5Q9_9NEIS|nr:MULTISPECIES: hypothetical protein [Snodgrassella]AHN27899.1 hypothetical protein SALWKB2_0517 [Snodgrassella alvi wkB2]MBI0129947.1 hypothetical protein [Snodgrassella sp. W8124]MBI0159414.1 hypothetical protein [Snodgrassella sp. W6238H11]MBI0161418.1 hypothetical protein [Snodgrassella sp. W6238H14]ORF28187.1 hypothetical protein BGI08_05625 [Snodgrassella alvi]
MKEYSPTIPVCQLDENNYFIGMTIADLDPLNTDGNYLIPWLCIIADEPELKAGYIPQWLGNVWKYIEDHRGETVYSKQTGERIRISELGVLPDDVTTQAPLPYSEWLEKAETWIEVSNADELRQLDKRKNAGMLNRSQILTQIELEYGKNKEKLVEIAERELTGIHLIKVRNAIMEAQTFTLENDDIWQFFTDTLDIDQDRLFRLWEEAKSNY